MVIIFTRSTLSSFQTLGDLVYFPTFFLVCLFVVVIVNFFSMLFRAFYVCRHATVLVTVFVTKMWRDDSNITWKGD